MKKKIAIHWFRFDLRVSDNPSLNYLSKNYDNIVGIYIFDDINSDPKLGSASKVWLHASLDYLNKQLDGNLISKVPWYVGPSWRRPQSFFAGNKLRGGRDL